MATQTTFYRPADTARSGVHNVPATAICGDTVKTQCGKRVKVHGTWMLGTTIRDIAAHRSAYTVCVGCFTEMGRPLY